ncbi:hypothetical protein SO802_017358 [Lithocarpus litseifolius]|uniref:Uncharacterized protein n=1 Tax=Lithocarpus litseifolius TaxID=425828 RepID=A0AAW2CZ33_9ROSI
MGITLQDIEVMLRVPVDGLPITGRTDMQWNVVCEEVLGHQPPPVIPNSNKSTLTGARIKYKWLDAYCSTQSAMRDSTARAVQHWPGCTGSFVVHPRRMRCRLEEHSCWCSYGLIQGSHEYALLRGRLYR